MIDTVLARDCEPRILADFTRTDCQLATFTGRVVLTKGISRWLTAASTVADDLHHPCFLT